MPNSCFNLSGRAKTASKYLGHVFDCALCCLYNCKKLQPCLTFSFALNVPCESKSRFSYFLSPTKGLVSSFIILYSVISSFINFPSRTNYGTTTNSFWKINSSSYRTVRQEIQPRLSHRYILLTSLKSKF